MTGSGDDDEAAIAREQPAADDVGTAWLARPAIPERPSFREAQGQDAYTKSNVEWLLHHAGTGGLVAAITGCYLLAILCHAWMARRRAAEI